MSIGTGVSLLIALSGVGVLVAVGRNATRMKGEAVAGVGMILLGAAELVEPVSASAYTITAMIAVILVFAGVAMQFLLADFTEPKG